MAIEFKTKALLLNVPLENDYKNTLYFNNKDEQEEYFKSRTVRTYNDFSYQRKDEPVRISTIDSNGLISEYDDLIYAGVNYVMYQNSDNTNKWYYAFITDIKYVSEGIVEVYTETDVMQTYLFDYKVKPSFVEREHVSDDTIGRHTLPENLEKGEYINVDRKTVEFGETDDEDGGIMDYIVIATTQVGEEKVTGGVYGGIYSGLKYVAFERLNYAEANSFLKTLANKGASDAVFAVFMAPEFVVKPLLNGGTDIVAGGMIASSRAVEYPKKYDDIDGYVPKNNKLFTYPYNFLVASNHAGGQAIYRYEDFMMYEEDHILYDVCRFSLDGVLCPGCSIKLTPVYYKNTDVNTEESINAGKYPICNWNTDVYTNWLTQNSVNITLSQAQSAFQIAGGTVSLATGNIGGGISEMVNGAFGIAQSVAEVQKNAMIPPQAEGNINAGDVTYALCQEAITFYARSIKREYAKIIDDYFHMYGYKINRVKIPNKEHRSRFWYTKTIGVNIDGAIPNNDIQKIKNCYDNGITFWRNALEIQNYNLDNKIAITDGAITDAE